MKREGGDDPIAEGGHRLAKKQQPAMGPAQWLKTHGSGLKAGAHHTAAHGGRQSE